MRIAGDQQGNFTACRACRAVYADHMTVWSSDSQPPAQAAASPKSRTRPTIAIVFTAVFVTNLDLFVVNVALPNISKDFHGASLGALSWVLNAYAIVFAALLVVAGRMADRSGHRRGFLFGLAVFTAGSALCALATDTGFLIGARVVQAVGAAVLMPTSLALLLASTSKERRVLVVRAWSAIGGVAAAFGPVFGGLLVQASWRWVFLINVPIGIFALVAALRVLPEVRSPERGRLPDMLGAMLLTGSIGALTLGLVQAGDWGSGSPRTIGTFAAAVVFLIGFLISSARHPSPIVEMRLLRLRALNTPTLGILLFSAAFAAMVLSSSEWAQNVWGYSALKTGLAIAPGPMMVPPLALSSGPLAKRIGPGAVAALGNVVFAAGILWWALGLTINANYAAAMLPGTLLVGIGIGLVLPTLIAAGAVALPLERFATGSGILNMARQLGAVIGVAVLVSVLGKPKGVNATHTAFQHGWYATIVIGILAAIVSLRVRDPFKAPRRAAGAPVGEQAEANVEVTAAP